jgi:hypothetical protein
MPTIMKNKYEMIQPVPPLSVLDSFKGYFPNYGENFISVANKFSNPEFFIEQWCRGQEEAMKQLEAEKEQLREERRARKARLASSSTVGADGGEAAPEVGEKKKKKNISWKDRLTYLILFCCFIDLFIDFNEGIRLTDRQFTNRNIEVAPKRIRIGSKD